MLYRAANCNCIPSIGFFCEKNFFIFFFFKKWLQRIQKLLLLYTKGNNAKFVSFARIQLDTKDTIF